MAVYNPNRKAAWNYGGKNWKLSRSKISFFQECPRCFYIDNKLGTKRPSGPPFLINSAVDNQLKNEFDFYRARSERHPLQREYEIPARPVAHKQLDQWRENFKGVQYFHEPTGMLLMGAIDDLWRNNKQEYIVVDYKATAKAAPIVKLEGKWHEGYKRQLEFYQWLVRKNGLIVSDVAYIVYCTGKFNQERFDKQIEFDIHVIKHIGDDSWVEPIIEEIKECLEGGTIPDCGSECEYCKYREAAQKHTSHD